MEIKLFLIKIVAKTFAWLVILSPLIAVAGIAFIKRKTIWKYMKRVIENNSESVQTDTMQQCPYCQSEINAAASRCPKCQSDLRNWFIRHKIISAIGVVIVVLLAFGQYAKFTTPKEVSVADNADLIARVYVTQILKAPATADFPSTVEDRILKDSTDRNLYEITSYVDAENSFGAKTRSIWSVRLRYKGAGALKEQNNWELTMLVFDGKLVYPSQSE